MSSASLPSSWRDARNRFAEAWSALRPREPAFVAAVLGWLVTVVSYYPGYMSFDSLTYLRQGRTRTYFDEQSPVVSWVFGRLDWVVTGPALMLVFQNLLVWGGLYLFFAYALRESRWRSWAMLVVGLWPGVMTMNGTIWKDVHMAGAFLLAAALVLRASDSGKLRPLVWAFPLLIYGTAARLNAAAALPPLCLWAAFVAWKALGLKPSRLKPLLASVLLFGVIVLAAAGWGRFLTKGKTKYPGQYLMIHDTSAISVQVGENLLPEYFKQEPNPVGMEDVRRLFWPTSGILLANAPPTALKLAKTPEQSAAIRSAWLAAIRAHPKEWLRQRFKMTANLFGFDSENVSYVMHGGIDPNDLGVDFRPSQWNRLVDGAMHSLSDTMLFKGWAYVLLLLAGTALAIRRNRARAPLVLAVASSALLYAAAYVVVCPSAEYRYLLWTAIISLVVPWIAVTPKTATCGSSSVEPVT
ncbi:MAG: hypothetical protein QM765_02950 [Myxococcales bacterium]